MIIAERQRDPRLQALFDAGKHVYSFSKLSSIGNCPYETYRAYILHDNNKKQGVWGVLGGKLHDKLEEITNGAANKEELIPLVGQELEYLDMLGLEFPKDFKGEDSIRRNWATNLQHFCDTFKPLKGEYTTEELLLLKVDDDHYLQGYADLIKHNKDRTISILDWKTSGLYGAEELKHAAHQLVIYGLAKEAEGYEIKDLAWIFMKYVEVSFMGKKRANSKKESLITKVVERRKLATEMERYIENDLYNCGYDEIESQILIQEMLEKNSLEGLPDEVKAKYKVRQYVKSTPFDDVAKEATWKFIRETIRDFEERSNDERDWKPRSFIKMTRNGKEVEDTFYCNSLCGYGDSCKYIAAHNEVFRAGEDEADEFEEWF